MKNILLSWNSRRIAYLVGGVVFMIIAIKDQSWWMLIPGAYFAAMAVFGFGCASGNCNTDKR